MELATSFPLLTKEETLLIARKVQSSEPGGLEYNRNVDKLVVHNLRLVISYVAKFMRSNPKANTESLMTRTDLLQQGAIGLQRAAQLYDPTKGYAFSTYAIPWIKQSVNRYFNKNISSIHIPENALRDSYSFVKGRKMLNRKGNPRCPKTLAETAKLVDTALAPCQADHILYKSGKKFDKNDSFWDFYEAPEQTSYSSTRFSEKFEDWIDKAQLEPAEEEIIRDLFLKEMSFTEARTKHGMDCFQFISKRSEIYEKLKAIGCPDTLNL